MFSHIVTRQGLAEGLLPYQALKQKFYVGNEYTRSITKSKQIVSFYDVRKQNYW